ncbi:MFS domain-containing protein [Mycena indigotica]|uniref:MFS domain-containing protein n=1 Tax=Mycena indigotica TaxID=2126181 RepID=A0A8H6TAU4_9AGAR|nr:MFS domain-containing protein [Mycena indigotica]KAF7315103.1 MFS domain-containing protein [Mycena indigotica]
MASRIPIRRPRTAGAENETRSTHQAIQRGKAAVSRQTLSKPPSEKPVLVASTKSHATTSISAVEVPGSAKRKREALREVTDRNRSRALSITGKAKAGPSDGRKIIALPKKSAAATRVTKENARPVAGRSLTAVQEAIDVDEDDGPSAKRQRTSSVGPEEEAFVAAELGSASDDEEEADPDGDDWEDLDAADHDDPSMASEYVVEIQEYVRQTELKTMPNPKYILSQPEITWAMRALLNEWLIQVHLRFSLLPETLFLCANLIDRFLSTRTASTNKLQLVGMACLLIAAKYEETIAPAVENYVIISEGATTAQEMLTAEQHILRSINWDMSYTGPMHFLRRISKADNYAPHTRTLGKYLAEIYLLDHRLLGVPPSMISAAAMWLARLALGETTWTPTLAHYAGYRESALIPVANVMLRYLLQPIKHESFYKKYAGKRNLKVSVYMRQWVLARWPESAKVDLALDLAALKHDNRLKRSAQLGPEDDGDQTI